MKKNMDLISHVPNQTCYGWRVIKHYIRKINVNVYLGDSVEAHVT